MMMHFGIFALAVAALGGVQAHHPTPYVPHEHPHEEPMVHEPHQPSAIPHGHGYSHKSDYGYQTIHYPQPTHYAHPEPAYHKPEPMYHHPEPAYHKPEPMYHAEPAYKHPEPAYHEPEPMYHPEPAYHEPEPMYHHPEPAYKHPEPAYKPEPAYHRPEPVHHKPEPMYHAEPAYGHHEPMRAAWGHRTPAYTDFSMYPVMEAPPMGYHEPAYAHPEPAYAHPEPAYKPEPAYAHPEPAYKPEPAYAHPEPAYKPEPAYAHPEPAYAHPEPAYHQPEPMYHHPEPAYHKPMVHKPHHAVAKPAVTAVAETPRYLGTFKNANHEVEGDIFLLDQSTLYIQGFSFDGQAPDVYFYSDGVKIPYYTRTDPTVKMNVKEYHKEDVVLMLPPEKPTIKDLGHFQIWCNKFNVVFGEFDM